MRPKIPHLVQALTGNFGEHHAFLCRLHLERIDQLTAAIEELSARIEEQMRPFARQLEQLATIPGVGQTVAEVIVAETGADMSRFRTAGTPGVLGRGLPGPSRIRRQTPLRQDPARRPVADRRAGHRRHGRGPNPRHHLPRRPLPTSRPALGKKKAIVAVEHSILIAVWHMLTNDVDYHDLGGDYFARLDPELAMRRIIRQANALGFTVRFDPIQAA